MIINKRNYLFRGLSVLGFMAFILISGSQSCYADRTQSLAAELPQAILMDSPEDDEIYVVRVFRSEVVVEECSTQIDKNIVFEAVEEMPTFPGGDAELMKFISQHLVYPALAKENGIQGRVIVKFVVKADGSIGDVVVVRSKDPDLDAEAVRVVKTLPKFNPGKMNGQPVNVWFMLPINFHFQ